MGLWTVVPERLQSPTCSLYKVPLQLVEQGAKGTISVVQKPINTFDEFVPKSGLNIAGKSINRNIEESKKKDTTQQKTNDRLLSKVPIPQIPFAG